MEVWEILQLARIYFCTCVCVVTIENDEVPDCQHRVPAGQGREESEEPWHYKVERWDSHRLLQRGCWETRKRSFSITGHCVGIHISANFCRCTKSTGNSLFRYFVLINSTEKCYTTHKHKQSERSMQCSNITGNLKSLVSAPAQWVQSMHSNGWNYEKWHCVFICSI